MLFEQGQHPVFGVRPALLNPFEHKRIALCAHVILNIPKSGILPIFDDRKPASDFKNAPSLTAPRLTFSGVRRTSADVGPPPA
ncbi:MAG: hypothetical protein ACXIVL_02305 [Oceanicaulis sp.]